MQAGFENEMVELIAEFLDEIGLSIKSGDVGDYAFLPGIMVLHGGLIVDEAKLLYPGDLLHEAGHLAVVPSSVRRTLSGEVEIPNENPVVIESAAMSWSYAASIHLGFDPKLVFHRNGYHGRSEKLLMNFSLGVFPGLHQLALAGMVDIAEFPRMRNWVRA